MAIYKVSFPNPNPKPGEDPIDTLDTAELKNTKLNDDSIRQLDEDKTVHIIKYEFNRRQIMPANVEQIYISASCSTIEGLTPEEILDTQTFVDEVANGAYQRKTPDSSNYIIEAKTKLKTIFANKLLEDGHLAINSRYDSFGYIYAGEDKIGTLESININSDREITMEDLQSVVNLENAQNLSIQIFINKIHPFFINIDHMKNDKVAEIESISKVELAIPEEVVNLKQKNEYNTMDDFWASRRSMINTNLVPDAYSLDDLDI